MRKRNRTTQKTQNGIITPQPEPMTKERIAFGLMLRRDNLSNSVTRAYTYIIENLRCGNTDKIIEMLPSMERFAEDTLQQGVNDFYQAIADIKALIEGEDK